MKTETERAITIAHRILELRTNDQLGNEEHDALLQELKSLSAQYGTYLDDIVFKIFMEGVKQ